MHDEEPTSVSTTTSRKAATTKPPPIPKEAASDPSQPKLCYAPLEKLRPDPDNVRQQYEDIEEFAEAIRADGGIMQSLLVRPNAEGDFTIIAGHRRYEAAKLLGLKEVPVTIREVSDDEKDALQLSENINRSDVSAFEIAQRVSRMVDRHPSEDKTRIEKVAKRLNRSPNLVRRYVALLKLDTRIVKSLERTRLGIFDAAKVAQCARAGQIPQAIELANALAKSGPAKTSAAPSLAKPKAVAPRVFEKRGEGFAMRVTFTSMPEAQESAFRAAVEKIVVEMGGAQ